MGFAWLAAAGACPLARASAISSVAAAAAPDCSVSGSGWTCYLPGIFRFLLVTAIILGLILAGAIVVAVKSYIKLKHEKKVDG